MGRVLGRVCGQLGLPASGASLVRAALPGCLFRPLFSFFSVHVDANALLFPLVPVARRQVANM